MSRANGRVYTPENELTEFLSLLSNRPLRRTKPEQSRLKALLSTMLVLGAQMPQLRTFDKEQERQPKRKAGWVLRAL